MRAIEELLGRTSLESVIEDHIVGYEFPPAPVVGTGGWHVGAWRADEYLIIQQGEAAAENGAPWGVFRSQSGIRTNRLARKRLSKGRAFPSGRRFRTVRAADDELVGVLIDTQGGTAMAPDRGWRAGKIFVHQVIARDGCRFEDADRADSSDAIVATGRTHVDVVCIDTDAGSKNVEKLRVQCSQCAAFNEAASGDIRIGSIDMRRTGERVAIPAFAGRASHE